MAAGEAAVSVRIRFVPSVLDDSCAPGDAKWTVARHHEGYAGLVIRCPGCGSLCSLPLGTFGEERAWSWDGNESEPTLRPSIVHTKAGDGREHDGCGWHGFLTAGEFVSC